jgi:malonyl-CoA O-methyltransferase
LPPVAPQAQGVSRQMERLALLSEPAWLHAEVARRLGDKLQAILLQPDQWLDWAGWLGAGQPVVAERYPQAQRFVFEPTPALAARSEQQWQAALPAAGAVHDAAPERSATGAFKALLGRLTAGSAKATSLPELPQPSPVFHAFNQKPEGWPQEGVGLVWANMALHAETDVPALLRAWHRALKVNGFVMCSGLGPDTARELKAVYQAMGWGLPTIDFIDMHDLGDAFVKAGFADPVMDMERITLTWPDAEALLAECRQWGGNVALGRHAGLRTPRWRARLVQALQGALMRSDGRFGLTLELVYGHAVKPVPRAAVSGETRVSLDDMKRIIEKGKRPGSASG